MIRAEHLYKSFDGRTVLEDVSMEFDAGKTNLIIGRSGSGKTVLLKTLVGLHEADQGRIFFDDVCYPALGFEQRKEIRKQIGMIFQGGALLDSSTVRENIRLPLDLFTNMTAGEKRDRVDFCMERVRLFGADKLYPSELSGGMVKRVAIARALVNNPKIILADEPTGNLDPASSDEIMELFRRITRDGCAIIMSTHNISNLELFPARTIRFSKGHIEELDVKQLFG